MSSIVKLFIFLIFSAIFIFFLISISNVVKLIIVSALFAYLLDPVVNFIESRGLSRSSATIILFVCLTIFFVSLFFLIQPIIISEIDSLKQGINLSHAEMMITNLENFIVSKLSFLGLKELNLFDKLRNSFLSFGDWLFSHVLDAASFLTSIIIVPFNVFFLLKDGREFKRTIIYLIPNKYFEFSLYLIYKLNLQVGNYIRGQLFDALVVGLLSIFALWALKVKYFFLIGVFAGIANLIPYFGPIAGATIAVVVSILQTGSFQMALYIIVVFIVIKLFDDIIVQPLVVAKSVHMNALIVLLAILAGGKLFGILGMLLSVPVTGFLLIVIREGIENYKKYRINFQT